MATIKYITLTEKQNREVTSIFLKFHRIQENIDLSYQEIAIRKIIKTMQREISQKLYVPTQIAAIEKQLNKSLEEIAKKKKDNKTSKFFKVLTSKTSYSNQRKSYNWLVYNLSKVFTVKGQPSRTSWDDVLSFLNIYSPNFFKKHLPNLVQKQLLRDLTAWANEPKEALRGRKRIWRSFATRHNLKL